MCRFTGVFPALFGLLGRGEAFFLEFELLLLFDLNLFVCMLVGARRRPTNYFSGRDRVSGPKNFRLDVVEKKGNRVVRIL